MTGRWPWSSKPAFRETLRRHPQRVQHCVAGFDASVAGIHANLAMFVHRGVVGTFARAGPAEGDAGGELGFERLPVPGLVGAGDDAAGGGAGRGAVQIEPDAGYEGARFRSDRHASAQAEQA